MIEIISGLPGGGKSYLSVHRILDALRSGRHVLTNVSIYPKDVAFYLAYKPINLIKGKDPDFYKRAREIYNRIHILGPDDVRHFYDYCYGGGYRFFIVLDEIQLYYDANDWAKTPVKFKSYLAQHRKGGDDMLLVTQHTKNIDVHFRRMTARYWHVHNASGLPFYGLFKLPTYFIANMYYGENTNVMARDFIRPNADVFELYDTMKEYTSELIQADLNMMLKDLDLRNKEGKPGIIQQSTSDDRNRTDAEILSAAAVANEGAHNF